MSQPVARTFCGDHCMQCALGLSSCSCMLADDAAHCIQQLHGSSNEAAAFTARRSFAGTAPAPSAASPLRLTTTRCGAPPAVCAIPRESTVRKADAPHSADTVPTEHLVTCRCGYGRSHLQSAAQQCPERLISNPDCMRRPFRRAFPIDVCYAETGPKGPEGWCPLARHFRAGMRT